MYKKFNIKILALVLGILLIVVIAVYLTDNAKGERSFRAKIVDADTSKITSIVIYPRASKDNAIELKKESAKWKVISGSKTYIADAAMVNGILSSLAEMKPQRLAATEKSRWSEFDVTDSAATRVKLFTGRKLATHLYVGRFSYQAPKNPNPYDYRQQGTISTFVRLANEKSVYSVEGFIGMSLDRKLDDFRDKTLVRFNAAELTRLTFTYPSDSSFTLFKEGSNWIMNGLLCDSVKVADYLNSLAWINGPAFADNIISPGTPPIYSLSIDGNNIASPIVVKAFSLESPEDFFISSSMNEGAHFNDENGVLVQKIFISRNKFLKESEINVN